MRGDIHDAIDSARSVSIGGQLPRPVIERRHSFATVRRLVLAVVRELPEDLSLTELREELEPRWPLGD